MDTAALVLSLVALIPGVATLAAIVGWWHRIQPWYRDWIPKTAIGLFRAMAAVAGVLRVAADPPQPSSWWAVLVLAAMGYLLWELAGIVGDTKQKRDKEANAKNDEAELAALRQTVTDAEADVERSGQLSSALRDLANKKLQRVREALRESELADGSLKEARLGLSPFQHARLVLEHFAQHLRNAVRIAGGRRSQNFRVALYAEQDGYLQPVDAFDLKTQRHDPFSSYNKYRDRFRLDNLDCPAHVVRCLQEGRMLIVEDCEKATEFDHFSPPQQVYLKSMVAFPLTNFSVDGATLRKAVIAIDTDEPGYFREDYAGLLEVEIEEFAVRLSLEYAISALVRDPRTESQE